MASNYSPNIGVALAFITDTVYIEPSHKWQVPLSLRVESSVLIQEMQGVPHSFSLSIESSLTPAVFLIVVMKKDEPLLSPPVFVSATQGQARHVFGQFHFSGPAIY
uniref:Uncharacterized protein n=1 Tax=Romanomermis culicivorax TaxID=13658 RepID=A0A915J9N1_ROMCU